MQPKKISTGRLHELDLLRGYFILVIIIDHIQRWPSSLTYITGEGRLWVSAAEGFFIISGLLVGYLRGYKGLRKSFKEISTILVKRAALLYSWSVIITLIAVALIALLKGDPALVPRMPETNGVAFIWQVLSQQYVYEWIYFLRLYWIMLLVAPLAIFLLRKKMSWLVALISIVIYALSLLFEWSEAAVQWQVLFFVPAALGFHLEAIQAYLRRHAIVKSFIMFGLILTTLITMALSYFWVLGWSNVEGDTPRVSRDAYIATREGLDPFFTKDPMAPARILLSFIWFGGLLSAIHLTLPYVKKAFGWLLLPFGYYSLTAYCLQAFVLLFVQFWILPTTEPLLNLCIGILGVMLIWGLLKAPIIRKIFPQ